MEDWEYAVRSVREFIDNHESAWNITNDYVKECKEDEEEPEWRFLRDRLMDAGLETTFDDLPLDDPSISDLNIDEYLQELVDEYEE